MERFIIKRSGYDNIDMIKPLWQRLNLLHYEISPHFKQHYRVVNWELRKSNIINKSKEILFEYALDTHNSQLVGYCISTIDLQFPDCGEIDSLFIEEGYRNEGLGKKFMENAINFLNGRNVQSIRLVVGSGNESVMEYYKQFGFYPSFVVLHKDQKELTGS